MNKQLPKAVIVRHPISKAKLAILDSFPTVGLACNKCSSREATVFVVESDIKHIKEYHITECTSCAQRVWHIEV